MNIYEIDFDEILIRDFSHYSEDSFTKEELSSLISQLDEIITNKSNNKLSCAYLWKFQLLLYRRKLAPDLIKEALKISPNMPEALIRLCILDYLKDDLDDNAMRKQLNKLIKKHPQYPCTYLIRASLSPRKKESYLLDCTEYIKLKPDSHLGYEFYGSYFDNLISFYFCKDTNEVITQDIDNAINSLTEAIRFNPKNEYNYFYRSNLYLYRSYRENDYTDLDKAVKDIHFCFSNYKKDNYETYEKFNLNYVKIINQFDTEIIENLFKKLLEISSTDTALYWMAKKALADFYKKTGIFKKSLELYTSMINQNSDDSLWKLIGYYGHANIFIEMEEHDKGLEDLTKIINSSIWNDEDIKQLIHEEIKLSDIYKKRIEILTRKSKLDNFDILMSEYTNLIKHIKGIELEEYYIKRADLFNKQGDPEKAFNDYTTLIEIADRSKPSIFLKDAYEGRIKYLLKQGMKQEAFDDFVKMNEIEEYIYGDDLQKSFIDLSKLFSKKPPKYEIIEGV